MKNRGERNRESQTAQLGEIPAFRVAEKLNLTVNRLTLEIYAERREVRPLETLHRKTVMVTARIAAGHAFGYDVDIDRNIHLCREAKNGSRECEEAFAQVARALADYAVLAEIRRMIAELRASLDKRVSELECLATNPDD